MRDVAAEVAVYLAERGEATALECARAIRARTIDVLHALRTDARLSGPYQGRDGRNYYRAAHDAVEARGTRSRGIRTHCDRVLDLLADGRWHSHMEGYQLGVILHSRVADLRRRGHRIDCRRDGDLYLYRLVAVRGEGACVPGAAGAPEAPRPPARSGPDAAPSPGPARQLELAVA